MTGNEPTIPDPGNANKTEANEDWNSNPEEPVDTYPDPRNANETETNKDSYSEEPVDTYLDPGNANETESNEDSNSIQRNQLIPILIH